MKKILCVFLAVLVFGVALSSCSDTKPEETTIGETTLDETTTVQVSVTQREEISDIVGSLASLCIIDNTDNSFIKADESCRKTITDAFSMGHETETVGTGKSYSIYSLNENKEERIYTYYPENRIVELDNVFYTVTLGASEQFNELLTPVSAGENATASEQQQEEFIYFRIDMIYPDCIICHSGVGNPYISYRFNIELSEEFCIGDYVDIISVDGKYLMSEDEKICEADAKEVRITTFEIQEGVAYKPVIYLYPERQGEAEVKLNVNGELICSYPLYNDGWSVLASPDGTLTDENGTYDYLFWEADMSTVKFDMSEGFCVRSDKTEEFFREKLSFIGLNEKEIADYLEFWLPHLTKNAYNYITFQTDCYTDNAKLTVTPTPDSVIRVYTVTMPLDEEIQVTEPVLEPLERIGFTVVEWGGGIVK